MAERPPVAFRLGDVLRLKRGHPCGGSAWQVDRIGADIGLRCATCGRRVLIDRASLERRLAGFETRGPDGPTAEMPAAGRSDEQTAGRPAPDGPTAGAPTAASNR